MAQCMFSHLHNKILKSVCCFVFVLSFQLYNILDCMPAILELLIVRAFCLLNYWFRASEDTALETLSGKGAQTKVFFYSNHYC